MCILLVEDEFLVRAVAQSVLANAGYEVLEARHGQEALQHLDEYPRRFTCLVTDYHMPGTITGGQVIEQMRPAYPAISMILRLPASDELGMARAA